MTGVAYGENRCDRESEGRRGQDHLLRESGGCLKAAGQRILLCDFDPQANATSGMGVDKTVSNGIYDVLINSVETEKAIVRTSYGDVLPSSKALAGASVEMIDLPERQFRLRMALEQVRDNYDYVFIDCPRRWNY